MNTRLIFLVTLLLAGCVEEPPDVTTAFPPPTYEQIVSSGYYVTEIIEQPSIDQRVIQVAVPIGTKLSQMEKLHPQIVKTYQQPKKTIYVNFYFGVMRADADNMAASNEGGKTLHWKSNCDPENPLAGPVP